MTKFSTMVFALAFVFGIQISAQHHKSESASIAGGPLKSATVTFGSFMSHPTNCTTPPCPILDRFVPGVNSAAYNYHPLPAELAKISVGGTINFSISGFHVIAIYDNGTLPSDIDTSIIVPPSVPGGPPRAIPIIDYSENRIYRGLDPALLPAGGLRSDRVENFRFDKPGLYLVICAVVSHFEDGMYGYVRVLPADDGSVRN